MATNTTNFNLSKPAYSDTADIAVINSNMDKVDTALQGLGSGLAIISKNNTHVAITAGQYVYVHGHSSLAEGLYTAKSNIAANATLSTSNLQADGSGGLNALNDKILSYEVNKTAAISQSFTIPNSSRHLILVTTTNDSAMWYGYVQTTSGGSVSTSEILKGSGITISTSSNTITFTMSTSREMNAIVSTVFGSKIS